MDADLTLEKRVMKKVMLRLLPLLILLYFFAFLDRVNVGFAALTMNKAIGLTPYLYGWGAGIFFIGYFLFEVPSNLALSKLGARIWIARILMTWGVLSALGAFVIGPKTFIALRFVLGAAEAGFFPGVILYLTFWFPKRYRARVVAYFMLANPISTALGSLVSGALLKLDGAMGIAGWQWLFVLEGLPSIALGFVALRFLTDRPSAARWLNDQERLWLAQRMEGEAALAPRQPGRLVDILFNRYVLIFGLIYFLIVTVNNGMVLWQPQIIRATGIPEGWIGLVNAIPFSVGALAMVFWGRRADRTGGYHGHLAVACFVACAGLVLAALSPTGPWAFAGLVIAAIGGYCVLPAFWALPTSMLQGTAAAAGYAFVNSLGNLGGFAGPYILGYVRSSTPSYTVGIGIFAVAALLAGLIALLISERGARVPTGKPQRDTA
ncbi:MFS transporter [Robbsia sp. KACC 23696]|uniref:MFS transporter n=1 Tax=Robbsia sp. KACC 23696 TaxID=3149231 RepID=UPI00325B1116